MFFFQCPTLTLYIKKNSYFQRESSSDGILKNVENHLLKPAPHGVCMYVNIGYLKAKGSAHNLKKIVYR